MLDRIIRKYEIGTLAIDGWAVTFGTAKRGLGELQPCPVPFSLFQLTADPSMASVPITVLLYDGPLVCSFNVAIKGLSHLIDYCLELSCECQWFKV